MTNTSAETVEQLIARHRRHVELSPGVGVKVQRYALAVLDDVAADVALLEGRQTQQDTPAIPAVLPDSGRGSAIGDAVLSVPNSGDSGCYKAACNLCGQTWEGRQPPQEPHRCSGCGLRWEGPLPAPELCWDCWRTAQPHLTALAMLAPQEHEETRRNLTAAIFLLLRIRGWDHMDTAGDGPYWRREINDYIAGIGSEGRQPAQAQGWQPIETVPPDVRRALFFWPALKLDENCDMTTQQVGGRVGVGYRIGPGNAWEGDSGEEACGEYFGCDWEYGDPVMWMPLPEPPS